MTEAVRDFIVQLLLEKGPIATGCVIDDYRYLDTGHIDSLAFIKFMFRLEEQFGIQLSELDISSAQIRTVGGLAHRISSKSSPC
ncbi:MAG: phosphopantetheine-binding protein [Accumulibacter sp.]|uniref:acyl carrier protein n=1 Tax=Accumulibacter sp. TaxID=2053492 RepID=UPI0033156DF0